MVQVRLCTSRSGLHRFKSCEHHSAEHFDLDKK
jgi:hypothetical protein